MSAPARNVVGRAPLVGLFFVSCLLLRGDNAAPVETRHGDDFAKLISTPCPDYKRPPDKLIYWPMPSDIAKRIQLNGGKMQKLTMGENSGASWNTTDPVSNARWKKVMDGLPDTVRLAMLNQTRSDTISSAELGLIDTDTLAMLQGEFGRLLTDEQMASLVRDHVQRQQYRQAAQVIERLATRLMGNPDLIVNVWNDQPMSPSQHCAKDVQTFVRQLVRLLPPPEQWTRTTLRKYGLDLVSALSADVLIRFRDSQVATSILERWLPMADGSFGCGFPKTDATTFDAFVTSVTRVQLKLMSAALGEDVHLWTPGALNRYMPLVPSLSPRILAMLDARTLSDSLGFLSQINDWSESQGFALAARLVERNSSATGNITADQLGPFMERMGYLGGYLLPEFLTNITTTSSWADLVAAWAAKIENFDQRGMVLPKRTASALLQYRLAGVRNVSAMSTNNLSQIIDANALKGAPWKVWKLSLRSDVIVTKGILQRLALERHSSLTDGQTSRLSEVAVRRFRNGDQWDMVNTPAVYWGGANLSELAPVPTRDVQVVVEKVSSAAERMNTAQIGTIYTKLRDDGVSLTEVDFVEPIKAFAPLSYYNRLSLDKLRRLAADMPADSSIRLHYAGVRLANASNVNIEILTRFPFLASHLKPEHIDSFSLSETPDLLAAIAAAPQAPPIQTTWALYQRLRSFIKARRIDLTDDDPNLLENAWLSNFDIYPAQVLAAFSVQALQHVSGPKKVEILRALGRLNMADYYTVPKSKRLAIIENGLSFVSKGLETPLDVEDLAVVGNAVLDLSGSAILRLTPRAFEHVLPIFQGDVNVFGGMSARPCLTGDQRIAIRRALKRVFGYPSAWDLGVVKAACCSLDTLTAFELDAIRDDILLDACLSCPVDTPPAYHLQTLRQSLYASCRYELGSTEIENGLTAGNLLLARRKASAAFNTYRDGKVYVLGINRPLVNDNNPALGCDAVVAAGSAAGFTVEQLKSLASDDVRDCLYELGAHPLTLEQASVLWNLVQTAYQNRVPKRALTQLRWILPGVDVPSFNSLRFDDSDVIAAFGSYDYKLTAEQLEAVNRRIVLDWRHGPELYTGQDLMILGRLLCGMNETSVNRIPTSSYSQASAFLGAILNGEECSLGVLNSFARKATDQAAFGNPSGWTAAVVRDVGAVIAGLGADQLRKVPPSAMQGLTAKAMATITPNNFRVVSADQIRQLSLAAAQAITANQYSVLSDTTRLALHSVIYGPRVGNFASTFVAGTDLIVALFLLLCCNLI